ncbi:MAG TPA: hypothetical protein VJ461_05230 [Candidatus Nanoarchaeia archaeon]|nr:hypothetical protein [Candidatus Nanoarchaeia archaeon]
MKNQKSSKANLAYLMQGKEAKLFSIVFALLLLFIIFKGLPVTSWGPSANYENVSVKTTVNVTNAYPEIINITCNNGSAITLTAGSTKTVSCLVQVMDYNGGSTINYANGTFYYYLNQSNDPDDNNVHYTNASCSSVNSDGYYANWSCAFSIWYYANNGTWRANITVNDSFGAKDNDYGSTSISALLALNVTNVIDFGNLQVTQTSSSIAANVTNFGNVPINVSVYGFGGEDEVLYAGLAMVCDQRNLTLPNERYSLTSTDYDSMTPVTGSPVTIGGLRIEKQVQPSVFMVNSTFWRLHVNVTTNPFGVCNGTVIFAAESP